MILVYLGYGILSYPLHARIQIPPYLAYPLWRDTWPQATRCHEKPVMASTGGFKSGCAKGITFCHTPSTPESANFFGGLIFDLNQSRCISASCELFTTVSSSTPPRVLRHKHHEIKTSVRVRPKCSSNQKVNHTSSIP